MNVTASTNSTKTQWNTLIVENKATPSRRVYTIITEAVCRALNCLRGQSTPEIQKEFKVSWGTIADVDTNPTKKPKGLGVLGLWGTQEGASRELRNLAAFKQIRYVSECDSYSDNPTSFTNYDLTGSDTGSDIEAYTKSLDRLVGSHTWRNLFTLNNISDRSKLEPLPTYVINLIKSRHLLRERTSQGHSASPQSQTSGAGETPTKNSEIVNAVLEMLRNKRSVERYTKCTALDSSQKLDHVITKLAAYRNNLSSPNATSELKDAIESYLKISQSNDNNVDPNSYTYLDDRVLAQLLPLLGEDSPSPPAAQAAAAGGAAAAAAGATTAAAAGATGVTPPTELKDEEALPTPVQKSISEIVDELKKPQITQNERLIALANLFNEKAATVTTTITQPTTQEWDTFSDNLTALVNAIQKETSSKMSHTALLIALIKQLKTWADSQPNNAETTANNTYKTLLTTLCQHPTTCQAVLTSLKSEDSVVYNDLLKTLCEDTQNCQSVLTSLKSEDSFVYHDLLKTLFRDTQNCQSVLTSLKLRGAKTGNVYNALLETLCQHPTTCQAVLTSLQPSQKEPGTTVYPDLLKTLCENEKTCQAVLTSLQPSQKEPGTTVYPDLLKTLCTDTQNCQSVLTSLNSEDSVVYTELLKTLCTDTQNCKAVLNSLKFSLKFRDAKTKNVYHDLLKTLCENEKTCQAVLTSLQPSQKEPVTTVDAVLTSLKPSQKEPVTTVYTDLLKTLCTDTQNCQSVLTSLKSSGAKTEKDVYNALLETLCKDATTCKAVLTSLQPSQKEPGTTVYTELLKTLCENETTCQAVLDSLTTATSATVGDSSTAPTSFEDDLYKMMLAVIYPHNQLHFTKQDDKHLAILIKFATLQQEPTLTPANKGTIKGMYESNQNEAKKPTLLLDPVAYSTIIAFDYGLTRANSSENQPDHSSGDVLGSFVTRVSALFTWVTAPTKPNAIETQDSYCSSQHISSSSSGS